jgi:ATPase, AAA family domain protein
MSNLATRMRPQKIEDVIGQEHLTAPDKILGRMVAAKQMSSIILYGPPGTGKTSMASALSGSLNIPFEYFNASTDDKKKLQTIAKEAEKQPVILLLDEIHRLDKPKQDFLLPYTENGQIILVGATTENPYISINPAIRSRATLLEIKSVTAEAIADLLEQSLTKDSVLKDYKVDVSRDTLLFIANNTDGDVRKALNSFELAILSTPADQDTVTITTQVMEEILQKKVLAGDKDGSEHYNLLSAFQKSIRGSDVNASLHYLARLILSGDLIGICRRLSIIAFEDIGLANPTAVTLTKNAIDVARDTGFPEARIPLAMAVVELALSPKSNNAYMALDRAIADINDPEIDTTIPLHLRDAHYKGADKMGVIGYSYPHDYNAHYTPQQYLPASLTNAFYLDTENLTTAHEIELVDRARMIADLNKGATK